MINGGRKNVLGVNVSAVDYDYVVKEVITSAQASSRLTVAALAVHGVMTGVLNPIHRYRLNKFNLTTPDGQPVKWALSIINGIRLPDRVYGPTLMLKICKQSEKEGLPIFLFGSCENVLDDLKKSLQDKFPKIILAGSEPSRFRRVTIEERDQTIAKIKSSGAALVFVGLGCPRQEVWVYENSKYLSMPLIAVGAAFDFHAGNISQAPPIMQKFGLEWLYRLFKEPSRLWKRYFTLNPLFVWYIFLQKTGLRRFSSDLGTKPVEELMFG